MFQLDLFRDPPSLSEKQWTLLIGFIHRRLPTTIDQLIDMRKGDFPISGSLIKEPVLREAKRRAEQLPPFVPSKQAEMFF